MKNFKKIVFPLLLLVIILVVSGYSKSNSTTTETKNLTVRENKENQPINLFVTHGHCSTPFMGNVDNLVVDYPVRTDLGNPLEHLKMSFDVDPNSFNVCSGKELTDKIKTPGLFVSAQNEKITFQSTSVYTMGLDWYQLNGKLSIKGVEKEVKFFVSGIRDPKESMASILVLEGQMDLFDWGIDYDKIVNGKSDTVPTKTMHINMKIVL